MFAMVNSHVYYSLDGGNHWTYTQQTISGYNKPIIQHPTLNKIYLAVFKDWWYKIRYTIDNGQSWTDLMTGSKEKNIWALAISESNPDYFYISSTILAIIGSQYVMTTSIDRSTDGGVSWTDKTSNLGSVTNEAIITGIEVHPKDPEDLWICFGGLSDGNKVFHSINGGNSWSNISYNLPNLPVTDILYDHDNHQIYIATDIGPYYMDYNGNTWIRMGDFPNAITTGLVLNKTSGKLAAATWGRGLWETEIPGHCFNNGWVQIEDSETWTTDRQLCENLVVVYGAELTIKSTVTMPFNASIVVVSNGSLIIDGGTLKNANIEVESGGSLIIKNSGVIELNNEDELNIANGAYFTNLLGEIKIIPED
jgi:hypothetical protein